MAKTHTKTLARYLPILDWGPRYDREALQSDLLAAVIVTIMLIPQSRAYAMLAGLPPEAGIYASIAPIVLYALFGSSSALAVGPVAVVSLMTAAAVGQVAQQGTAGYATAALTLAALSGVILLLMGIFRLGFLANFLSHPVISGFITASGILIAVSQLRHILGTTGGGDTLPQMLVALARGIDGVNFITLAIGAGALAFLFWQRKHLKPLLVRLGLPEGAAVMASRAGPVAAVVVTTLLVWGFGLDARGVSIVGDVPQGLPPLTMPGLSLELV
ncbi:MAG: SulP family inorganic anion transporter, partial [Paracoccus sp. (in: a-proteobacteria)]|nr:SulP family inorganic anion transporter [Paracoccus sp. (in: a-proteobacteria)]